MVVALRFFKTPAIELIEASIRQQNFLPL